MGLFSFFFADLYSFIHPGPHREATCHTSKAARNCGGCLRNSGPFKHCVHGSAWSLPKADPAYLPSPRDQCPALPVI